MSTIATISSASIQEISPATALTSKTTQPAANVSHGGTASTANSANTTPQDTVTLLKASGSGSTSGAPSDLAQLKADQSAQQNTASASSFGIQGHLVKNMTSLLSDLATGSEGSSASQALSPIGTLADHMAASQNAGNQNGSGSLVNTSA